MIGRVKMMWQTDGLVFNINLCFGKKMTRKLYTKTTIFESLFFQNMLLENSN